MKNFKTFLLHLLLCISLFLFLFSLFIIYEYFDDLYKLNVNKLLLHSLITNIISWFIILIYCGNRIFFK